MMTTKSTLQIGTTVFNAAGDAGTVKESDYSQGAQSYYVRWDGFDLNPHWEWVNESALVPPPPSDYESRYGKFHPADSLGLRESVARTGDSES